MAEANKDEIEKCKHIAQAAYGAGDADKAKRFLQKAQRMDPNDASIAALFNRYSSAPSDAGGREHAPGSSSGPRYRASAASASRGAAGPGAGARTNKDGGTYTGEQMQDVQRILRESDYYAILGVPRDAGDGAIKKAYRHLALKFHPDKNRAPGAEDAFKKISKAFQCLTDEQKRQVYDTHGDEERMPQHHRQHFQRDFVTPDELFSAFFGGPGAFHFYHPHQHHHNHNHHQRRRPDHDQSGGGQGDGDGARAFQLLPLILLVVLTFASSFASRDRTSRFAFTPNHQYRNELVSATLNVKYYVMDDFDDHYAEGTQELAGFEQQVEVYYVRNLQSECDYQEKVMYKQVMIARRRGNKQDLQKARSHPRPACRELQQIKGAHPRLYSSAFYRQVY